MEVNIEELTGFSKSPSSLTCPRLMLLCVGTELTEDFDVCFRSAHWVYLSIIETERCVSDSSTKRALLLHCHTALLFIQIVWDWVWLMRVMTYWPHPQISL